MNIARVIQWNPVDTYQGSVIFWVNVVLSRIVVDSDRPFVDLCGSHLPSKVSCITSVDGILKTLVIDLIGQLSRDVIGSRSVKP